MWTIEWSWKKSGAAVCQGITCRTIEPVGWNCPTVSENTNVAISLGIYNLKDWCATGYRRVLVSDRLEWHYLRGSERGHSLSEKWPCTVPRYRYRGSYDHVRTSLNHLNISGDDTFRIVLFRKEFGKLSNYVNVKGKYKYGWARDLNLPLISQHQGRNRYFVNSRTWLRRPCVES